MMIFIWINMILINLIIQFVNNNTIRFLIIFFQKEFFFLFEDRKKIRQPPNKFFHLVGKNFLYTKIQYYLQVLQHW